MRLVLISILLISGNVFGQVSDFDSISLSRADSISKSYFGHKLDNPEAFARELTRELPTDVEKFRAIFRWVCENISYDIHVFHQQQKKERQLRYNRKKLSQWQQKIYSRSYKRVLNKKLGVCSGYSTLVEVMSRAAGLQCVTLEGYGRNYKDQIGHGKLNHAWNSVQLGTKWYLADATWASGYVDSTVTVFTTHFNSVYFLTDPAYFITSHYPKNEYWAFVYDKPTLEEFQHAPILDAGFIKASINRFYPETGKLKVKRDSSLTFGFTSNAVHQPGKVYVELKGQKFKDVFTYSLAQNRKGELYFVQKFIRKGLYRVHIYLGGWLAFVYEVSVS